MTQKPRPQDELKNYMFMFMDCAELPRLYPSEWNSLYISNLPAGIRQGKSRGYYIHAIL